MTEDWDFYFLNVDDKPASMYVDLGAIASAPVASLRFMAYVHLQMNSPREDGLSSQTEFNSLIAIEDSLKGKLVADGTAYVGRCTTDSCRDFFFYAEQPDDWIQRIATCMRAFPAYKYEAATREDPNWSTYREYLYPSDADRQTIENRRVCEALEKNGDKLSAEREIDHWAYFPDAQSRSAFVTGAAQLGFATRTLTDPVGEDTRYGAQVWRTDVPSYQGIDNITFPLFNLAEKHSGEYDGWESVVVN